MEPERIPRPRFDCTVQRRAMPAFSGDTAKKSSICPDPGGHIEVAFGFASPYAFTEKEGEKAFEEKIEKRAQEVIDVLLAKVPGLNLSVFAYGRLKEYHRVVVTRHVDAAAADDDAGEIQQPASLTFVQSFDSKGYSNQGSDAMIMVGSDRDIPLAVDGDTRAARFKHKVNMPPEIKKMLNALRHYGRLNADINMYKNKVTRDFWPNVGQLADSNANSIQDQKRTLYHIMDVCYEHTDAGLLPEFDRVSKSGEESLGPRREKVGSKASTSRGSLKRVSQSSVDDGGVNDAKKPKDADEEISTCS